MSSTQLDRCMVCGALVDLNDLFCSNCGREVSDHRATRPKTLALKALNFECHGCGASMNYDASVKALKCPFCGSVDLQEDGSKGILEPEAVIPFAIDHVRAETMLMAWLGSSFWHPSDIRSAARLTELRPVFVPYWIFTTLVKTHWTADSGKVPWNARASWAPVSGSWERTYPDLWIPASEGVTTGELVGIEPFDISTAVPPQEVDLEKVTVEQFSVARRYARPLAQSRLEALEAAAVSGELGGSARNIHVNVLMQDATSQAALAPVFIMAYRYRSKLYRFILNGQNGRSIGRAPISITKILMLVALIVSIVLMIGIVIATKSN